MGGYRILVEHLDLNYKSPMLSKFLRSVVETVDILEYNWIKRFFKFPNKISLRYKYEIRRGEVVRCGQIAVYRSVQRRTNETKRRAKRFFFSLSRRRRPYEAMDPCYQERCWAVFFRK